MFGNCLVGMCSASFALRMAVYTVADLLVRVATIDEIKPHPNADRLDLAVVGGWQCVVGRGNWKQGDRCVYFPPDCMLPEDRCKEFEVESYVARSNRFEGMGRLRAIKLRGEPSFGLCIPVPAGLPDDSWDDCAWFFGAQKYEPPARLAGPVGRKMYGHVDDPDTIFCSRCCPDDRDVRDLHEIQKREVRGLVCTVCGYTKPVASYAAPEVAAFPRYTDIQNLRHYPEAFQPGDEVVVTEKIHGANCRIGVVKVGETTILKLPVWEEMAGSHNVRRTDPADNAESLDAARRSDTYWYPWTLEPIRNMLGELSRSSVFAENSIVLYGEVYGPGIQTLTYGLDGLGFCAFDLKVDGKYLPWKQFTAVCDRYGIETVPELGRITWKGPASIERVRAFAEGPTTLGADHIREGVVLKLYDEERNDPKIGRIVLKFCSDTYLSSKDHENETDDDEYPEGALDEAPGVSEPVGRPREEEEGAPPSNRREADHSGNEALVAAPA